MNQGKTSGWSGRGSPVEDAALIRKAMEDLLQLEAEFPIKVEGAHTLPYTARVHRIDPGKGMLYLKLIRPLPHELPSGAAFEMLFSSGDQRFEAPTLFHGREDYLLYRFTIPSRMAASDRRSHKRYPFRPREKAYVVAQDGGVPGHGLSGPLVNLSLGGLAFRVDRVMRLDDHLRVTPGLGFFDRGKPLPMIKIRDLPNLPVFEARGTLANAAERDGEIIVGVQFGELGEAEKRDLQDVLDIRDHMQRASYVLADGSSPPAGVRTPMETTGPAARIPPAGAQTPDALRRLGRRCARLVLAMEPGPDRDQIRQTLRAAGFLRLETVDGLDQALAHFWSRRGASYPLLVLDAGAGDGLPMAEIQTLQREFRGTQEWPVALMIRDGAMPETGDPLIRPMPRPTDGDPSWQPLLDELAGLD